MIVHLRAGDEGERRQIALQQASVLDDEAVDADVVELPGQAASGGELVVAQQGIERGIDAGPVFVGVPHQGRNRFEAIARRLPRPKARRADVDRVGAAIDGSQAALQIARGREQLDGARRAPEQQAAREQIRQDVVDQAGGEARLVVELPEPDQLGNLGGGYGRALEFAAIQLDADGFGGIAGGLVSVCADEFEARRRHLAQFLAQLARQALERGFARLEAASRQDQQCSRMLLPAQQQTPLVKGEQPDFVIVGQRGTAHRPLFGWATHGHSGRC